MALQWLANLVFPPEEEPCFQVRAVPGRGMGAIATRRIRRGECIISEKPAIMYKVLERCEPIRRQFHFLAPDIKDTVMALHDAKAEADGSAKTLEGIYLTNGVLCGQRWSFDSVLCVRISMFNHSCSPNCENMWDASFGVARIFACRDIDADSELCVCYVDPRQPRSARQQVLMENYGFQCDCIACSASSEEAAAASDQRRERLMELDDVLANGHVQHFAREPAERAVKTATEVFRLCKEEGLVVNGLKWQAACHALRSVASIGDVASTRRWAEGAFQYSALCRGLRHPETQRLHGFMVDPLYHPAMPDRLRKRSWREHLHWPVVAALGLAASVLAVVLARRRSIAGRPLS
eukprot:TRINITY_DN113247_c0_g1_i1.p1 TRINITY_DN113247_c0_g1~~TRINITY_DN113247_c0_g1_i1.p1  ORF type:complete len:351 (+),score=58.53 TRINITY_DN113247_c0_g1_i1:96-1148(+)